MINQFPHKLVLAASLLMVSMQGLAETNKQPLVPLASISDYALGDGWSGIYGIKLESLPAYAGAKKYTLEIKPEVAIQWRQGEYSVFLEGSGINGIELGWRGLLQPNWLAQTGLRHETVLPSGDTEAADIDNFPHRGSHILVFFENHYALSNDWKSWLGSRIEAGPDSFGYRAKISVGHGLVQKGDGAGIDMVLFSSFGDKKNLNNYFGVSEEDAAASGLQVSELKGGYRSSGLNLIYRTSLKSGKQIKLQAGIEAYSDEVKKSALVTDDIETRVALSYLWRY